MSRQGSAASLDLELWLRDIAVNQAEQIPVGEVPDSLPEFIHCHADVSEHIFDSFADVSDRKRVNFIEELNSKRPIKFTAANCRTDDVMSPCIAILDIAEVVVNTGLMVVEIFPRHTAGFDNIAPPEPILLHIDSVLLSIPREIIAKEVPQRLWMWHGVRREVAIRKLLFHIADAQSEHTAKLLFPLWRHTGKLL